MRVIKSSEEEYTCRHCRSVIGIRPDEIHTIGPPGPYDMDYEPDEIGSRYWYCPVCKKCNGLPKYSDFDDDYY